MSLMLFAVSSPKPHRKVWFCFWEGGGRGKNQIWTARRQCLHPQKPLSGRNWKWYHARVLDGQFLDNIVGGISIFSFLFFYNENWMCGWSWNAKQNGASNNCHEEPEYRNGNCYGNCTDLVRQLSSETVICCQQVFVQFSWQFSRRFSSQFSWRCVPMQLSLMVKCKPSTKNELSSKIQRNRQNSSIFLLRSFFHYCRHCLDHEVACCNHV